jgi:hypothetical protein
MDINRHRRFGYPYIKVQTKKAFLIEGTSD